MRTTLASFNCHGGLWDSFQLKKFLLGLKENHIHVVCLQEVWVKTGEEEENFKSTCKKFGFEGVVSAGEESNSNQDRPHEGVAIIVAKELVKDGFEEVKTIKKGKVIAAKWNSRWTVSAYNDSYGSEEEWIWEGLLDWLDHRQQSESWWIGMDGNYIQNNDHAIPARPLKTSDKVALEFVEESGGFDTLTLSSETTTDLMTYESREYQSLLDHIIVSDLREYDNYHQKDFTRYKVSDHRMVLVTAQWKRTIVKGNPKPWRERVWKKLESTTIREQNQFVDTLQTEMETFCNFFEEEEMNREESIGMTQTFTKFCLDIATAMWKDPRVEQQERHKEEIKLQKLIRKIQRGVTACNMFLKRHPDRLKRRWVLGKRVQWAVACLDFYDLQWDVFDSTNWEHSNGRGEKLKNTLWKFREKQLIELRAIQIRKGKEEIEKWQVENAWASKHHPWHQVKNFSQRLPPIDGGNSGSMSTWGIEQLRNEEDNLTSDVFPTIKKYYEELYEKQPIRVSDKFVEDFKFEKTEETKKEWNELTREYDMTDLTEVLKKVSGRTAPGFDSLGNKFLKLAAHNKQLKKLLLDIFNQWRGQGGVPAEFSEGILTFFYKSKDKYDIANYRPITLLSAWWKVYWYLEVQALERIVEKLNLMDDAQVGFRRERSTIHNIECVDRAIRVAIQRKLSLYLCFIDLKKAYDSVPRGDLWRVLLRMGCPRQTVRDWKETYENSSTRVRYNLQKNLEGGMIKVERGVRQGCPASPFLFNCWLNVFVRWANRNYFLNNRYGLEKVVFAYADDLVFLADSKEILQKMCKDLEEFCFNRGAKVSIPKTKVMVVNGEEEQESNVQIYGENLEQVTTFKYLGFFVQENGKTVEHISTMKQRLGRSLARIQSEGRTKTHPAIVMDFARGITSALTAYAAPYPQWTMAHLDEVNGKYRKVIRKCIGSNIAANNAIHSDLPGLKALHVRSSLAAASIGGVKRMLKSNLPCSRTLKKEKEKVERKRRTTIFTAPKTSKCQPQSNNPLERVVGWLAKKNTVLFQTKELSKLEWKAERIEWVDQNIEPFQKQVKLFLPHTWKETCERLRRTCIGNWIDEENESLCTRATSFRKLPFTQRWSEEEKRKALEVSQRVCTVLCGDSQGGLPHQLQLRNSASNNINNKDCWECETTNTNSETITTQWETLKGKLSSAFHNSSQQKCREEYLKKPREEWWNHPPTTKGNNFYSSISLTPGLYRWCPSKVWKYAAKARTGGLPVGWIVKKLTNGETNSEKCSCGEEVESIWHMLQSCPNQEWLRETFEQQLKKLFEVTFQNELWPGTYEIFEEGQLEDLMVGLIRRNTVYRLLKWAKKREVQRRFILDWLKDVQVFSMCKGWCFWLNRCRRRFHEDTYQEDRKWIDLLQEKYFAVTRQTIEKWRKDWDFIEREEENPNYTRIYEDQREQTEKEQREKQKQLTPNPSPPLSKAQKELRELRRMRLLGVTRKRPRKRKERDSEEPDQ